MSGLAGLFLDDFSLPQSFNSRVPQDSFFDLFSIHLYSFLGDLFQSYEPMQMTLKVTSTWIRHSSKLIYPVACLTSDLTVLTLMCPKWNSKYFPSNSSIPSLLVLVTSSSFLLLGLKYPWFPPFSLILYLI